MSYHLWCCILSKLVSFFCSTSTTRKDQRGGKVFAFRSSQLAAPKTFQRRGWTVSYLSKVSYFYFSFQWQVIIRLCLKCLWNNDKPILRTIFILYWLLLAKLFISFTSERKCNLCTKMYSCNLTTLREFFTFIGIVKISINWQWVSWSYYREYISCKATYSVAMLSWPRLPFQIVAEFLLTQIIQLK